MSRSPTPAEVINAALDSRLDDLYMAIPGRVERYDAAKQLVDVQPLVKRHYTDEEGADQVEALPVVPNVPIVYPGGGGFTVTFPLTTGDTVLLVFASASLDSWLQSGGLVDPIQDRHHSLADGIAIPGLRDFGHPRTAPDSGAIVIGKDGNPRQRAVLGETLKGHLDAIRSTLLSLTGQASFAVSPPTVPDILSDTVKVTE